MDNFAIVAVLIVIVVIVLLTFSKPGRQFMLSWTHQLFGTLSAEAKNLSEKKGGRPEQSQENTENVSQEMVGSSGGKQVAKDSRDSSQKIT